MLSNCLQNILSSLFVSNRIPNGLLKEMCSANGPLSNFSSKISICYAFGLIEKDVYDDLNKIRKLRNFLSHSSGVVDFNSKEISSRIENIKVCEDAKKLMNKFKRYSVKDGGDKENIDENEGVVIADKSYPFWHARSLGLVSYNKSAFCIGLSIIEIKIKDNFCDYMKKQPENI